MAQPLAPQPAWLPAPGGGSPTAAALPDLTTGAAIPIDALAAAAQREGSKLSVIALPRDWANWGKTIDGFKAKYGMAVTELSPNAGSVFELETLRANKTTQGSTNPDVVDISMSYGPEGKEEGLFARYKSAVWDSIPDALKDPDGCGGRSTSKCWFSRRIRSS